MKRSIYYFLILVGILSLFGISACFNASNPSENPIDNTQNPDDSCFTDYRIFGETAFLWQQSWVSYYNAFQDGNYNASPFLRFDKESLDQLYSEVRGQSNTGVLLYYVMQEEDDAYPSLAMRNTVSCQIDTDGTIIMASSDTSDVRTISQAELTTYMNNWNNTAKKFRLHIPNITTIN